MRTNGGTAAGLSAVQPRWVEVNAGGVRVENLRQFGGQWLALHLIRTLQLDSFLEKVIPEGRESVPWDVTSLILISEIGRMLGKNSRAARLFDVKVTKTDKNATRIEWSKVEVARDWATLSAGCYLLRTNVADWSDEELWKAYIQLTEAESAFRIHKSDLSIRPIWHTKEERVLAHIFVCFLAYVLW